MQHMVVYRSLDGKASYFQADDLDGAVRHVEHLRNAENVVDSRIFSMQEVPIEFRPYYRVEVAAGAAAPAAAAAAGTAPGAGTSPGSVSGEGSGSGSGSGEGEGEAAMAGPTPVPSGQAASRFGLFNRS